MRTGSHNLDQSQHREGFEIQVKDSQHSPANSTPERTNPAAQQELTQLATLMLLPPPGTFMFVVRARPLIPSLHFPINVGTLKFEDKILLVTTIKRPKSKPRIGHGTCSCLITGEDI